MSEPMGDTAYEPIVQMSVETGVVRVSRSRDDAYYLEAEPIEMAGEADESLRLFRVGPFGSLTSALRTLAADGGWVLASPTAVHPDVRGEVAALVTEAARAVHPGDDEAAQAVIARWRSLLER